MSNQYVKDLEVSHHNLRHLVTHQGGEIENLRAKLVDLTGDSDISDPVLAAEAAMLAKDLFVVGQDSASTCGSPESTATFGQSDNEAEDSLVTPISPPVTPSQGFQQRAIGKPERPELVHPTPKSPPALLLDARQTMAMPISIRNASIDSQQMWSSPTSIQLPVLSSSNGTDSSLGSSWSETYTPPTASTAFDGTYQFQPFLANEAFQSVPYSEWQPEAANDLSNWMHQCAKPSQFCLPYQDAGDHTMFSDFGVHNDAPTFTGWQGPNALGLENLFPSLSAGGQMSASPLQLLGRPPTPFRSLASPNAEYAYAT